MNLKKNYTKREMEKILKANGWVCDHQTGGHKIYRDGSGRHLSIAIGKMNSMIFRRLVKEHNMVLN